MKQFQDLDQGTRIVLILLFAIISYLIFLLILRPILTPTASSAPQDMMSMHTQNMMNFSSPQQSTLNIAAILLAALVAFALVFATRPRHHTSPGASANEHQPAGQHHRLNELAIIKKALSADEKAVLEEVERAGEITQDSLRFRLNWSKAKVSAILTNLDRLRLVQRQRTGKTYTVMLSPSKTGATQQN